MATDPLDAVLAQICKDYGKGAIRRLGDQPLENVQVISTGVIALDEALGVGGLPCGRIVEMFGPESSGKTSVALKAVGMAQKAGMAAAFIDAEHALDPAWAEMLGVDTDALLLSQPDNGEQALNIAEDLIDSGAVGIVVIDSVAALVPKAELDGEVGDHHVGLMARMMSQALRKLSGKAANAGTTVVFINQLRDKVGVFFGSAEVPPGGKALKFYASIRLDVRRVQTIKDGATAIGNRVRVEVKKNKCSRPFEKAEFDLMFGEGISREAELIDLGVARDVIRKSGAWYTYNGEKLGQGKEKSRIALLEQPALADAIENLIRGSVPDSRVHALPAECPGSPASENAGEDPFPD